MSEVEELIVGKYSIAQYDIDHFQITYNCELGDRRCYICGGDFEGLLGVMLAVKEDSKYVEEKK